MVHRAPDSRLLNNLIAHEKEYTKHLTALFPLSHTALASLSAYAAAYPSSVIPPSQTLSAVVDVLATADDALQRYNRAVESWREQLVSLKGLEDDVGAVLRDRDILVTRLIKASKSTKTSRDVRSSLLVSPPHGSASMSSLPSTISLVAGGSNSKLGQAQAELQACEAHLLAKERELEARRIAVAREGLGARCRALIDCGWVWGEMGKQGLEALQALTGTSNNASKPLLAPSPYRHTDPPPLQISYASDNSSITPSQSASQTAARSTETSLEGPVSRGRHHDPSPDRRQTPRTPGRNGTNGGVTIALPPAHAIADIAYPTAQPSPPPNGNGNGNTGADKLHPAPAPRRQRSQRQRRPPSQHITEVSDEDEERHTPSHAHSFNKATSVTPFPTTGTRADESSSAHDCSSDDDAPQGPLEIVENDPFAQRKRKTSVSPSPASTPSPRTPQGQANVQASTPSPQSSTGRPRERRTSMAFFGSIRGLFRHKPKERGAVEGEETHGSGQDSPGRNKQRLSANGWVTRTDARIKSKRRDDTSDEDVPTPTGPMRRASVGVVPSSTQGQGSASGGKLRKGRPPPLNGASPTAPGFDGWITDSAGPTGKKGTIKRKKKKSVADLRGGDHGHSDNEIERRESRENGHAPTHGHTQTPAGTGDGSASPTQRDSSVTPVPASVRRVTTDFSGGASRVETSTLGSIRRSVVASATVSIVSAPGHDHTATTTKSKSKPGKAGSGTHYANGIASQSLMSIVEDVTRLNREGWGPAPVDAVVPKAPSLTAPVGGGGGDHQKTRSLDIPRAPVSVLSVSEVSGRGQGQGSVKACSIQPPPQPQPQFQPQSQSRPPGRKHHHHRSSSTPVVTHEIGPPPPLAPLTLTSMGNGGGQGRSPPKLPLRSALRNSSRTPSPSQTRHVEGVKTEEASALVTVLPSEAPVLVPVPVSVVRQVAVSTMSMTEQVERGRSPSLVSISSYVTVRESFGDGDEDRDDGVVDPDPDPETDTETEGEGMIDIDIPVIPPPRSSSLPRATLLHSHPYQHHHQHQHQRVSPPRPSSPPFSIPPPPAKSPPPQTVAGARSAMMGEAGVDVDASVGGSATTTTTTTSTSTDTLPRRKSVRVSLNPTFSSTPPARDDDEEPWRDVKGRSPRAHAQEGGGWKMRNGNGVGVGGGAGVWEDSSEEDEMYRRARTLLTRVGSQGRG